MEIPINEDFKIKVAGVTYENRQDTIKDLNEVVDELELVREPSNQYDENAIKIMIKESNIDIGYVPRNVAKALAPIMDSGEYEIQVTDCLKKQGKHTSIGAELLLRVKPKNYNLTHY